MLCDASAGYNVNYSRNRMAAISLHDSNVNDPSYIIAPRFSAFSTHVRKMSIQEASSGKDFEDARRLFVAYAQWLNVDLTFQDFRKELDSLPAMYSAPKGGILLARDSEGNAIGCIGFRPFRSGGKICEMKRLYVLPEGRGLGLGRLLVGTVLDKAKACGFIEIRMDSLPHMVEAISLYKQLGFEAIPSYFYNPHGEAVFVAKELV